MHSIARPVGVYFTTCLVPFEVNCIPFPGCQTEGAAHVLLEQWLGIFYSLDTGEGLVQSLTLRGLFHMARGSAHTVQFVPVSILHYSSALDGSLGAIRKNVGQKCFCNISRGACCQSHVLCPHSPEHVSSVILVFMLLSSGGEGPCRQSSSPQQPPVQDEGRRALFLSRLDVNSPTSGWRGGRGYGL